MARDTKVGSKPTGSFKFVDGPGMNMPRDNSGGPEGDGNDFCCSSTFGDGGKIIGEKSYLSQSGGSN